MDYPNVPFFIDSSDAREDPILLSVARSGAPKLRRLYSAARRSFVIQHRGLTDAQKATVEAFLDANRMIPFSIIYPCRVGGVTYAVVQSEGKVEWSKSDGLWRTSVLLIQA